jgi:hypothetical protein
MKTLLTTTSSLALLALMLTARAQTLPVVTSKNIDPKGPAVTKEQTADRRAAAYKGPKVVNDTKALGSKMLRDSKPANKSVPVPAVKQ